MCLLFALCLFLIPFPSSMSAIFPPSLLPTPSPAIPPQLHSFHSLSLSLPFSWFPCLVSPGDEVVVCPALPWLEKPGRVAQAGAGGGVRAPGPELWLKLTSSGGQAGVPCLKTGKRKWQRCTAGYGRSWNPGPSHH